MSNLQILSTERLNKLIDETQLTLQELKQEVIRREHLKQEHEIKDLEHHMSSAEFNLNSIKNFIAYLLEESKKNK
ncbi:hypothetical protein WNY58_06635 [Neptuniibacter pectenicola]|jgi:CO/xanthine dehydrogenase FAD-binding subunit|uniref:DUF904 domain-containing protein n=1 Tax=Neptuniibacter pectenicola TaxID=1806669 RepID=A0ABU9TQR9_9GAMM|nr:MULTISPECIES: hypothetical protein [Neptuniibacter]MDO6513601.1 hypothetical protein [Neptuniibacter sp. 2_MG-2023]MDO6593739.1 hypothetical protein [Neptuniibacter sp. 1_MG-2023]|tara:strand:+ start:358 stop:582 length:225 start_codon:yes stop_codon:yes gene_type:complete